MAVFTINVSTDEQKCEQCGRTDIGFYESKNLPGKYICNKCVMDNVKRSTKESKRGQ